MVSLHLRVHYDNKKDLKRSMQVLTLVSAALLGMTYALPTIGLSTTSYVSGIGFLCYSMALFYEFTKYFKNKYAKTLFKIVIAVQLFLLVLSLINLLAIPKHVSREIVPSLGVIILLVLPLMFWDELHEGVMKNKKASILLILPLLLAPTVLAANNTLTDSLDTLGSVLGVVKEVSGAENIDFFEMQKKFLTSMLDMSDSSGIILLAMFLAILYLVMKFITTIIKWIIIIVVLWIAITFLSSGAPMDVNRFLDLV